MKQILYISLFLLCFDIIFTKLNENKHKDIKSSTNILSRKHDLSRRNYQLRRRARSDDSSVDTSSSTEETDWKDEWTEYWLQKKLEAINASVPTGDTVNMVAARPWGVPCGDPNQHDVPWGSCMLPMECEPEYRIYRGDASCGRTRYVCCALQLTNYDLYPALDVSFADSELASDSDSSHDSKKSKERKRKGRKRSKKRRQRQRKERKRKLKRAINRILREVKRILNRTYRNGTKARKKKTRHLKKFIKSLKKKYLQDRNLVRDIHEEELIKIDEALENRLEQLKKVNQQFMRNDTFRDIVVNGTINRHNLRLLLKAYPELEDIVSARRSGQGRPDYLEYDIEYGYVYE